MRSEPADILAQLPALNDGVEIDRRVSGAEYYHASVGASARTLEHERRVIFALAGTCDGSLTEADWQQAIARISAVNPGLRLRWRGGLGWSRFTSDGPLPRLRMVEHCDWDRQSGAGFEFVTAQPIDLRNGPTVEFIVARQGEGRALVVLRTVHAIMDGMGGFHCLRELFRALRGEPLLGSNVAFSDADLVRAMQVPKAAPMHEPTCWLTGEPEGDAQGDDWWRLSLGPARSQLLARVAVAMAEFAHQHTSQPALIAVPVDLRRHAPAIRAVTNFSSMLLVRLMPGDGIEAFQQRLRILLDTRREASFGAGVEVLRWFPLRWLDRLLGRTPDNYRTRRPMETGVISNLGRIDLGEFSVPGFRADDLVLIPQPGSAFAVLMTLNDEVTLTMNLPRVLSSGGRDQAWRDFLRQRLAD